MGDENDAAEDRLVVTEWSGEGGAEETGERGEGAGDDGGPVAGVGGREANTRGRGHDAVYGWGSAERHRRHRAATRGNERGERWEEMDQASAMSGGGEREGNTGRR